MHVSAGYQQNQMIQFHNIIEKAHLGPVLDRLTEERRIAHLLPSFLIFILLLCIAFLLSCYYDTFYFMTCSFYLFYMQSSTILSQFGQNVFSKKIRISSVLTPYGPLNSMHDIRKKLMSHISEEQVIFGPFCALFPNLGKI